MALETVRALRGTCGGTQAQNEQFGAFYHRPTIVNAGLLCSRSGNRYSRSLANTDKQTMTAMRKFGLCAITVCWLAACASPPQLLPQAENSWYLQGQADLAQALAHRPPGNRAVNVILFIGDGLDISTITAARILEGQQRGEPGEENFLSFESFPYTGLAKTYNTNQQTPDSAGTATAMLAGVKTKAGVIGLADGVVRGSCASAREHAVDSIFDLAEQAGLATGIVTTARITHATPAAAYAHVPEREWEVDSQIPDAQRSCKDIARQLVEYQPGDGIDVIFGGGRRHFMPGEHKDPEYQDRRGHRMDGADLIETWREGAGASARYIWNRAQFDALASNPPGQVLGLFERSHMRYEADRSKDIAGEPSLSEMTAKAISLLQRNPRGYFLLVEGGRIDHGHHDGNAYRALTDTIAFARAVGAAKRSTRVQDTLIIVTSDHGHTLRIAGYPTRGNPILGLVVENGADGEPATQAMTDLTGLPYTTLGYQNGPGYHGASDVQPEGPKRWPHSPASARPASNGRADLSSIDTAHPDYLQEAGIPTYGVDKQGVVTGSETHSGGDVPIYASGPGAHLLSGVHEQNYIFHVMRFVQGL